MFMMMFLCADGWMCYVYWSNFDGFTVFVITLRIANLFRKRARLLDCCYIFYIISLDLIFLSRFIACQTTNTQQPTNVNLATEVERRFKSIREKYRRRKILMERDLTNNVESTKLKRWDLYSKLSFLDDYMIPRK